jgi:prefoldin alpha subunit
MVKKLTREEKDKLYADLQERFNVLLARAESIREQIRNIDSAIVAWGATLNTLKTLKSMGAGKTVHIPIGPDIKIKAKLEEIETVIMNVGGGVYAEFTYDEVEKKIAEQVALLEAVRDSLASELEKTITELKEILPKVRETGVGEEEGARKK